MEVRKSRRPPYNPEVGELIQNKRLWTKPLRQTTLRRGFLGWHENGYLPHRDEPGLTQFVTFRLADAFPEKLRSEWQALLEIEDDRRRQIQLEAYLDRGKGGCHLMNQSVAALVQSSFLFGHRTRYDLHAWVIMPNHVHVLFQTYEVPMTRLVDAWKGFTAKQANKLIHRKRRFWQKDYWDTYMRDEEHEAKTRRYIENNPVKAKLTQAPEEWLWSSARFRNANGTLELPKP